MEHSFLSKPLHGISEIGRNYTIDNHISPLFSSVYCFPVISDKQPWQTQAMVSVSFRLPQGQEGKISDIISHKTLIPIIGVRHHQKGGFFEHDSLAMVSIVTRVVALYGHQIT
jgi:hypothetical protein